MNFVVQTFSILEFALGMLTESVRFNGTLRIRGYLLRDGGDGSLFRVKLTRSLYLQYVSRLLRQNKRRNKKMAPRGRRCQWQIDVHLIHIREMATRLAKGFHPNKDQKRDAVKLQAPR
jgi:hypothetical protein